MDSSVSSPLWRNMCKKELELQYSPSRWSKRFPDADKLIENHLETAQNRTNVVRKEIPYRLDIEYGEKQRSKLDIYGEDLQSESYIGIFVHGGYWQELNKDLCVHPVEPLYKNNIVSVVMGYTLAPDSCVSEIVVEVKKGIRWVCEYAKKRGSKGVFLMGWSAGAQLIIQSLVRSNEEEQELFKIVFGIVTFSGVFDLRPLVKTYVNEPLQLNEDSAWAESPLKFTNSFKTMFPHIIALITYGVHDSDEFKRQSIQYSQELVSIGIEARCKEYSEVDHFSIVENLCNAEYELMANILKFVNNH